jgi:hypothetical protein
MRDCAVNAVISGAEADDDISGLQRSAQARLAKRAHRAIMASRECCQDRKLLRSTASYENGGVEECDVG